MRDALERAEERIAVLETAFGDVSAERDAAFAERDKWRGVCVDVGRVIDALGKDIVDLPLLVLDAVKQRDAALTEARRVLREVEWMFDNGYDAEDACPLCHQPHSMGHTPTCALAAVLAQEEAS